MSRAGPQVVVDSARGLVQVRDRLLSCAGMAFVARALSLPAVSRVDFDLAAGSVTVQLAGDGPGLGGLLEGLAAAVRTAEPVSLPADAVTLRRGTIWRVGRRLTTWRVGSDAAGTLRFRHPRMRRDRAFARGLERLVITLPGVHDARISGWSSDLVVHVDPESCDGEALLEILQRAVDERAAPGSETSSWSMAEKTATLGLLAATDLMLPALAPVCGLLIVGGNLPTITAAAGDLRRLRIGPATVATAIICGTLATGQFLAAGIMAWSFDFWRRRHRRDIEAERTLLLEDAVPMAPRLSLKGPAEPCARVGERLAFELWDVVPADGRIVSGGCVMDERAVTGRAGCRWAGPGEQVPAGAVIVGGDGVLEVERGTPESRVAGVIQLLAAATAFQPGRFAPTIEADRLVTQFAGPTLATAGLGLLAGDLTTAVAVMRPDYGSAEAMSLSFEDLDAVACGLGAGCLLSSPRVLDSLAKVDTVVVLDDSKLAAQAIEIDAVEYRAEGPAQAEMLRMATSLARHVAGPRRDVLAGLAAERGCVVADVVPESFGGVDGLRIVHRQGGHTIALSEPREARGAELPPLVLTIDDVPQATFSFRQGQMPRAAVDLERITAEWGLRLVVAACPTVAERLPGDERLPTDPEVVGHRLAELRAAGHRLAIVGPPEKLAEVADLQDVTVALGLGGAPGWSAGIVCLAGEIAALADLLGAAAERRHKLAAARRLSILPNAACVAGAFLFGFTSVVAAVVSNLGTLGIYRRASGGLHRRRRRHWLRQRAVLPRLAGHAPTARRATS